MDRHRLGIDLDAWPDLTMNTVSGRDAVTRAILRRLTTPRGGLFYDPTYGTDIREWVNETLTDETLYELTMAVTAECEKDERVLKSFVVATPNPQKRSLRLEVTLELVNDDEPLRLIVETNGITTEVLYAG